MRALVIIVLASALAAPARAGDLLDQIVLTVNGKALLQSDWDEEVCYEAFLAGRPLTAVSASERESALNRVIDQELLREQMHGSDLKLATTADVDEQVSALQVQFAQNHPGLSWHAALESYGLTEPELRERVELQLDQLRLVDEKLRPSVEVDASEVAAYYREKIAPLNSPARSVTLSDAEPKIRQILVQQKINQMLDSWLASLRAQAKVQRVTPETNVSGGKAQ